MSGRRRFGAIRKLPSGRFQVRFRDPETNLYRTAEQTFATKGDAGRWLSILETDLARGLWHDPKRGEVLLGEVAETWYSTKLHLRETTKHIYRVTLDAHILPAFGEQPIGSITTMDVQVWIAALHQKPRCGPNTVAKTYKQLRTIMEMALDAGLIVRNPCRIKGAGTERLPEMRCATVEEVTALAQAVEPRWQALILLAAYSGLRWGELAGLRRRYLDPLHKTVRVVEQCTEVNGRFVWGPPKTAAGMRTVVLPSFICDVMVEHLARWSEPGIDGLVFVMPEGGPLRRENFRSGCGSRDSEMLASRGACASTTSGTPTRPSPPPAGPRSAPSCTASATPQRPPRSGTNIVSKVKTRPSPTSSITSLSHIPDPVSSE